MRKLFVFAQLSDTMQQHEANLFDLRRFFRKLFPKASFAPRRAQKLSDFFNSTCMWRANNKWVEMDFFRIFPIAGNCKGYLLKNVMFGAQQIFSKSIQQRFEVNNSLLEINFTLLWFSVRLRFQRQKKFDWHVRFDQFEVFLLARRQNLIDFHFVWRVTNKDLEISKFRWINFCATRGVKSREHEIFWWTKQGKKMFWVRLGCVFFFWCLQGLANERKIMKLASINRRNNRYT